MADESLGIFNQERYKEVTLNDNNGTRAGHLSPATTDGLANHAEAVLSFMHVPSESDVFFKAFITTFQESYSSDWNSETVFGRTDPIYTFKNTQRRFTLAWKIPAETVGEAYNNLAKVQRLAQFLYPNYADIADTSVLSQSPLVRLKVMNLAQTSQGGSLFANATAEALFSQYSSTNDPSQGLLGAITSLNVNHNLENKEAGVVQIKQNTVLPKLIEVSIDFAVIHESTLGWNSDEKSSFKDLGFPYNAQLAQEAGDIMEAQSYDDKINARQAAERGRQQAAQDLENAKARNYDGMFGKARRRRDINKLARLSDEKENLSKREQANFDYLASAQRGYIAQGEDTAEQQSRAEEFISEFID